MTIFVEGETWTWHLCALCNRQSKWNFFDPSYEGSSAMYNWSTELVL